MAQRTGRCTNFGNCDVADTKQTVNVTEGADFLCPGCSRQLTETGGTQKRSGPPVPLPLIVILALVAALGGLLWLKFAPAKKPETVSAEGGGVGAQVMLRLHGSNTIGAELAPALAQAFLKDQGATDVRSAPAGADRTLITGALPGETSAKAIEIEAHGSATAFQDLTQSKCDIGMASRKVNTREAGALAQLGDMTSPQCEHVLGLDGIAIIVNPSNPVASLTRDQAAKIFSGQITEWKQVLSQRGTIKVYARDDKSGTYDSFKAMVLADKPLAPGAIRIEDSRELSDRVAADPDAIGFIGLPYIHSAKAVAVSEEKSQPLLPTRLTVATEDYLLSRRLYLYTPANPQNAWTRKFVAFALSKAGQQIVDSAGFVGQNVQASQAPVSADAPGDYKRLTAGAERLSLDFRFRTGSAELDNKALADLDRMVTFLSDLKYSGGSVVLAGFADSTGRADVNLMLSRNRASAVAGQFAPRGIAPGTVTGFGASMPVASNETAEGREKNRRVEVWLKK